MKLKGKTLFLTGGSRGIGLAIAVRAAAEGANVAIAAKTAEPHPKLPGTIFTAAEEIERAGGKALPILLDVRDAAAVEAAVAQTVEHFGGIDICVNNASAISLTGNEATDVKRFDLINQINVRGTWLTSRACVPHLRRSSNPHVLTLSPPLDLKPEWFGAHTPYTLSKYGMSMCALGFAEEYRREGIASNTLWPRTTIATAAVQFALGGDDMMRRSRRPEIMADAAIEIFTQPARTMTGRFLLDDAVLAEAGVRDFDRYRVDPTLPLMLDLFVDPAAKLPLGVTLEPVRSSR